MMGRGHALSGYVGGAGLAEVLIMAPWQVRLMAGAVVAGGALLPDLDQVSSTASRSLGVITRWLARGVAWTSREVYYATRLGRDPVDHGGHRLITHTYPGAVVFGLLAAVACGVSVYAGAVAAGLMIALGVSAVPSLSDLADDRVPGGGLGVFAAGGTGSWWTLTHYPGWWWTVPLAVTCGAVLHREGDWCTKAGVPRRTWPLPRDGRRWDTSRAPLHWTAGDDTETVWVTPALGVIAVAAVAWVTGLIPWVIARVAPLIG